ncbi:MAG: O-antigen ligase family protein [Candidatus Omnitrophota bacterium]
MPEKNNILSALPSRERIDLAMGVFGTLALGSIVFLFQSPVLLLAILFAISGLALFLLGRAYFAVAIYLLLPFSFEIQIASSTRITAPTEILIPLLFLLYFADLIQSRGKIQYRPSPINIPIMLLYFLMIGSLAVSQAPISTVKALIRDTGYIFTGFYLIPRYIQAEKQLKTFVFGSLIAHSLLILYGFATQAMGGIRIYANIAGPFFVEHCIYAAFITMTFAFLLAYYLDMDYSPIRNAAGALTGIFLLAIVLTFVRAAWISISAMLLYYLFQFRHRRSSVEIILALIALMLFSAATITFTDFGQLFLQRIETITDFKYVANYDRLDRWYSAIAMWKDHPYFGVGWGAYPDVYYSYQQFPDAYSARIRMGAHNLYLELLAETGLAGLILFALTIFTFFQQAIYCQGRTQSRFQRIFIIGMQGAMITYLVHAFLNNLGPSDKIGLTFWLFLGMIPALRQFVEMEKNQTTGANGMMNDE